jgi:hypothetical protein
MDGWVWAVIIAAAIVLIAAVWAAAHRRQRQRTLSRFGPEYDRALEEHGDRRAAERDLLDRARRRDEIQLRPLTSEARHRYRTEWQAIQGRFVDAPEESISAADRLLDRVMRERGYPVDDPTAFEDKAALLSVDHPQLVQDYRAARDVQQRNAQRLASTDDLRQAVLRYRSLFEALLDDVGPDGRRDHIDLDGDRRVPAEPERTTSTDRSTTRGVVR